MAALASGLLKPELCFLGVEAQTQQELFSYLEKKLGEKNYLKQNWLQAITEREKAYPTGLAFPGVSVAIPHVDPQYIEKPYIAVVKPQTPVSFEGMAGTPALQAELVVNLGLLSHAEEQVGALQTLMKIFMNEELSAQLLAQKTAEALYQTLAQALDTVE